MNIQKLTNYLVIGLGVLGAVFLGVILAQGDDTIEMNAMQGDFGFITANSFYVSQLFYLQFSLT